MFLLYLLGGETSIQFNFLAFLVVFCFQIVVVFLLVVQGGSVSTYTSTLAGSSFYKVPFYTHLI